MPRAAREKSKRGIYHVMLRGVNKQQIFEEKEDYEKFIQILEDCKEISKFELYAYCLMGNHIHLLLRVEKEPLETVFRRIGSRFVYWYNIKYERHGHLFQDRYKSEPIDDDAYFVVALRYILRNPVKAGLCKYAKDYQYSNFKDYVSSEENTLSDTEMGLSLIGKEEFEDYINTENNDSCLEIEANPQIRITDEKAKKIIHKKAKCDSVADFQEIPKAKRDKLLRVLKEQGLSIRQISRLTGTPKGVVERAVKDCF